MTSKMLVADSEFVFGTKRLGVGIGMADIEKYKMDHDC